MAIAAPPASPSPPARDLLTYEQYLVEPEIVARYDIIDGVRIFMANPTRRHQRDSPVRRGEFF